MGKVNSGYLQWLVQAITTFVVPLSDINSCTLSEFWKYVSVCITVGYYFQVDVMLATSIYALLTNKRSVLRCTLSAKLVSAVIAVHTLHINNVYSCHYRVITIILLLKNGSNNSQYGCNLVYITYLLLMAGDVELNPGPLSITTPAKRRCTHKDRFMADLHSRGNGILTMNLHQLCTNYDCTQRTIKTWLKNLCHDTLTPQQTSWATRMTNDPIQNFKADVESDKNVLTMTVADIATHYCVTAYTARRWLKSVKLYTVQVLIDNILTKHFSPDSNSVAIAQLAKEHGLSERYVKKCLTDLNRQNFVLSNDIDMTDKEISDKYGVRRPIVASWKLEADNMWLQWYDEADKDLDVNPPTKPTNNDIFPHCICHECAVILFQCDVQWVDKGSVKTPYRATKFQGLSYSLTVAEKDVRGQPRVGSCRHCANKTTPENLFDDFGDIPDCIKAVSGFGESRRLALGSLYCSTFKPSNYSYVHCSGKVGFSMNTAHLRGMAGMLKFGDPSEGDITAPYNRENVLRAFQWLRKNNPLYSRFMAQLETLYGYLQNTQAGGLGNPVPMVSGNVEVQSGQQLSAGDLVSKEGMFVLVDPDECLPRVK